MKAMVTSNPKHPKSLEYTRIVTKKLTALGITVLDDNIDAMEKCNIVVGIGGDGSIIHIAKRAAEFNKPVLGINCGKVGFITELNLSELDILDKIQSGTFTIQKRNLIKVNVTSKTQTSTFYALNDAVILRDHLSKLLDIDVYSSTTLINHYRADGLVFATATGSTAYSLSAGGPIIDTSMECIVLTPVCPHTVFSRPIVFGESASLSVHTTTHPNNTASIIIDGDTTLPVTTDDNITITTSNKHVQLIKLKPYDFCETVSTKLCNR